jgi:hypothetical protein
LCWACWRGSLFYGCFAGGLFGPAHCCHVVAAALAAATCLCCCAAIPPTLTAECLVSFGVTSAQQGAAAHSDIVATAAVALPVRDVVCVPVVPVWAFVWRQQQLGAEQRGRLQAKGKAVRVSHSQPSGAAAAWCGQLQPPQETKGLAVLVP